ncbi:MAG: hypothetical protein ACR2QM_16290 [Longimicrobiales bacterium]
MARHNRTARGVDQCGFSYEINYQPDWLARVKVTRRLPSGRQSTKVLFRNPARAPVEAPPSFVRVAISSAEQDLSLESTVGPQTASVREVRLEWRPPGGRDLRQRTVTFTFVPFRTK